MNWISVKDRLPTIPDRKQSSYVKVLMANKKEVIEGRFRLLYKYDKSGNVVSQPYFHSFYRESLEGSIFKPTHWMELPTPPQED